MTTESIPILDLGPETDHLWDELNQAVQKVMRAGQFINGPEVVDFEKEAAKYLGTKHAIGLNSGTDALVIGLRALGIGPGDEVITSSFSFFATAEAISLIGATPVFADIDPVTYTVDAEKVAKLVTPKTKAIIPVHLYGQAADMDAVMTLAKRHGLAVLEDVAQAFGGSYKGKKVGTIGTVGAYSFFPSKNLGAFGDGGLLSTDDDRVADVAKMLRTHGGKKKYHNELLGYNSRLDTLQAAILRVKLPHIDKANDGRRAAAHRYNELLAGIAGVVVPEERPGARHVFHQYTVRIQGGKRDAVHDALAARGIMTMLYYPLPIHRLPYYVNAGLNVNLPLTEAACGEVLSLPIWPQIPEATQAKVVSAIAASLR